MNNRAAFYCMLILFGALLLAMGSTPSRYRRVQVLDAPAIVIYGDFRYRIEPGETACGPVSGDNRFECRVVRPDGSVRFQPREP